MVNILVQSELSGQVIAFVFGSSYGKRQGAEGARANRIAVEIKCITISVILGSIPRLTFPLWCIEELVTAMGRQNGLLTVSEQVTKERILHSAHVYYWIIQYAPIK
jgi:hypothetical protein